MARGSGGEPPARLPGIDLMRGVAAFAVVNIHSLGAGRQTPAASAFVNDCLALAVPYFLAAAFFFSTPKLIDGGRGFFRSRFERLVVPYLAWTAIYAAVRTLLYLATHRAEALRELWGDPLRLVLMGGSSVHLYFVPMLLVGELIAFGLARLLGPAARRPATAALLAVACVALAWPAGEGATAEEPAAAPAAWRLLRFGALAAANCLPYVGVGFVLASRPVRSRLGRLGPAHAVALLALAAVLDVAAARGALPLPGVVGRPLVAFAALGFAIAASPALGEGRLLAGLGAATLGIYLSHHLVIEGFELLLGRRARGVVDLPTLLAFSAAVFLTSWGFILAVSRVPVASRLLVGVRPSGRGEGREGPATAAEPRPAAGQEAGSAR